MGNIPAWIYNKHTMQYYGVTTFGEVAKMRRLMAASSKRPNVVLDPRYIFILKHKIHHLGVVDRFKDVQRVLVFRPSGVIVVHALK